MDIDGGSDLARTGILVVNEGIDRARAELLGLADDADRAGKRAGDAGTAGASRFSQSFVEAAKQSRIALEQGFATTGAGIREALARDLITTDQARAAGHEAAVAYKQGLLAAIDQGEAVGAFSTEKGVAAYRDLGAALKVAQDAENAFAASARQVLAAEQAAYAQEERRQAGLRALVAAEQAAYAEESRRQSGIRQMALLQAEAIAMDERRTAALAASSAASRTAAAALGGLETGAVRSGVSLNTVRAGLTALLASSLQTAPGVAQLGSSIGALALGTATTVGVLAGVAAITGVYRLLTDDARKAKEEQDKLTESLEKWYDKQRDGASGELQRQIGAEIKLLGDLRTALDEMERRQPGTNLGTRATVIAQTIASTITSFNPVTIADEFERRWNEVVERQKATVAKGAAEVAAAGREAFERDVRASMEYYTTQASSLSGLISSGTATGTEVTEALRLLETYKTSLRDLQGRYASITDAKARAFNLEQQVSAANNIRTIGDALRENYLRPTNDAIAATELYTSSIRNYIAANEDALKSIEKQSAALEKRKPYLIGEQQLLEQIAAANKIIADLPSPNAIGNANTKNEEERNKELLREMQRATAATANVLDGLAREFHRSLASEISGGLREGFGALGGLFDSALGLASSFGPQLAARLFSHRVKQTTYDANGNPTGTVTSSVPGLSAHDTQLLGSFGAAATATQHFADALNELAGITHLTAQRIEQDTENRVKFYVALDQYRVSAIGNPTEQQLAQIRAQADSLRGQAEVALAGKRREDERNEKLAQITAIEQQQIDKLASDFGTSITQQLNALNGTAGAYANELARLKAEYESNLAAAQALGTGLDDVKRLYDAQVAAAKAAYDEGQRQLQFSLDAREAAARGESVLAEAITRRAQEEAEIFKAQQDRETATQIAQRRRTQALEDERAALTALNDATTAYLQNIAKGPTGTSQSQLAADLAPLTDRLAQDQANYDAAVKLLADDLAAGADATTIYADRQRILTEQQIIAGDQAAITAAKFSAAAREMSAAQSAIQRDISLGFTSQANGRALEAQAFGFGGLTDDQIRALYTPFAGAPLTNEQEQTNKNIEQFFRDFPTVVASAIAQDTVSNQTPKPGDAVSYAARNLSEITGNRMADYLNTEVVLTREALAVERQQLALWQQYFGFGGLPIAPASPPPAIPFYAQPLSIPTPRVAGSPVSNVSTPSTTSRAVVAAPQTESSPLQVIITHRIVGATGKIDLANIDDEIEVIAEKLEAALIRRAKRQRLADGSPLLVGS